MFDTFHCNVVLNSAPQNAQFPLLTPCTSPHTPQTIPFTGSLIFFVFAKIHSPLSSISNSAEHSGQIVLPGLASRLWFRQKGHFKFFSSQFSDGVIDLCLYSKCFDPYCSLYLDKILHFVRMVRTNAIS